MAKNAEPKHLLDLMQALATDIGRGIHPLEEILAKHGISAAYYANLCQHPKFAPMLLQARKEWEAADNTPRRIEHKAAIMFEEAMPEFMARIHDKGESMAAKVEFMKLLAKTGKLGLPDPTQAVGETFKVTIHLGNNQDLNIEKQLPPKVIDAEALEFAPEPADANA